jgi:hypothetical protein
MIPDDRGLSDHHARTMVDEECASDPSAGMNLHARSEPGEHGEKPRHEAQTVTVAPVRDAVREDGVKGRVTQHDLQPSVRRRIVATHRLDVLDECFEHHVPLKTKAPATGVAGA